MDTFRTLYHRGKNGEMWQWHVAVDNDKILTTHGIVGGKMQTTTKRAERKNIGKSNETSPSSQAWAEAAAMYKFKLERKYSMTPEGAQESSFLPMLAHEYGKKKKYVKFPCHAQPKLDGLRGIARWKGNHVVMLSRNGKVYNVPHITRALEQFMDRETVLDGELYVHGKSMQSIASWAKKLQPDTEKLQYHVYDVPEFAGRDDETWLERFSNLMSMQLPLLCCVKVPTYEINNESMIADVLKVCEDNGYEGIILRNLDGLYLYDHRSTDLLKVKSFLSDEFKVVGAQSGRGKFEDVCIWVCETAKGQKFNVTAAGTQEEKEEQFRHQKNYLGKMLTVRYQNETDDGLPRFPIAIGFRLAEDMP